MGKKKWKNQQYYFLAEILALLKLYDDVLYIGQSGYKDDFFAVFANAYQEGFCSPSYRYDLETRRMVYCQAQRPRIHGDTIWAFAKQDGWVNSEMEVDDHRYENIHLVMTWWNEWTYAWDRNPPKRRWKRK